MPDSNGLTKILKECINIDKFKLTACKFLGLKVKGVTNLVNEVAETENNKVWSLGKNTFAACLVILPEIPAYFIPSFNQAKATGDAKAIKNGEGARGLITGGLEGLAVGSITATKTLGPAHLIPFILFGAGLQFISSKVFPIVGEKIGKIVYNDKVKNGMPVSRCSNSQVNVADENITKPVLNVVSPTTNVTPVATVAENKSSTPVVAPFKGINFTKITNTTGLKV